MKVEVRPIQTKRWHGKIGAESFTRPKTLNVLLDSETRQYATGLDYETKSFTDPENPKVKITEDKYYEKLLKVDLSAQYIDGVFHSFWDSKTPRIKLENKTMYFDTARPLEYLKIKLMKASKFVANSMKEYEEGFYPEATHVITDEAEEIEVKASKVALKKQATIKSADISKDKKIQLILILDGSNLRGKSDNHVEVALDKLIDKKPKEVLEFISMDSNEAALHALILESLQRNILRKAGHKIMYHDASLGNDVQDVIAYLSEDDNQDLKLRLMSAVNE